MSHELWSCCLGWYQPLAHWWKLDVCVSWSGIRIQGRASSKVNDLFHLYFTCSSFAAYIWQWMILWGQYCLFFIFWWLCVYPHSDVFSLRCLLLCQMCQCNKVLHTVEFSTFPVIWLLMGWTLGEALSAVVHLYSEHPNVYTVIDKPRRNVCTESFSRQYSVHS